MSHVWIYKSDVLELCDRLDAIAFERVSDTVSVYNATDTIRRLMESVSDEEKILHILTLKGVAL